MRHIEELGPLAVPEPGSPKPELFKESGNRVNLLALGDVGTTLLTGLRLMGGGLIESIGIYDTNRDVMLRLEMEMNQMGWPLGEVSLPVVEPIEAEALFDCDVFIFCASRGVPQIGAQGDVRMMQFEANRKIAEHYGRLAKEAGFKGVFAVVSDPVDPLCKAVLMSSGLKPWQIQGFGLGVMNMRARYFAEKDRRFAMYLTEGRAFGPHGGDLVIANSIYSYDDQISKELTELTTGANMRVRELGFKPYMAPAISSGAIPILLMLKKQWHYSSLYFGTGAEGAFLGIKNRMTEDGPEFEDLPLDDGLYERIKLAYENLKAII